MKAERLTSLIRILNSTGSAPQRLSLKKLAPLAFDQSIPNPVRGLIRELTILSTDLIKQGKLSPVAVADHMLEELDQFRAAEENLKQQLGIAREQLARQPAEAELVKKEEKIAELEDLLMKKGMALEESETQKESAEQTALNLTAQIEELGQAQETAEHKVLLLKEQLVEQEELYDTALAEKEDLKKKIEDLELEQQLSKGERDSSLAALRKELAEREKSLNAIREPFDKLNRNYDLLLKERNQLKQERDKKEEQLERIRQDKHAAEAHIQELTRANSNLKNTLKRRTKNYEEQTEISVKISTDKNVIAKALEGAQQKISRYEKMFERIEPDVFNQWIILFNRIYNEVNKDPKRLQDAFLYIYAIVDYLFRKAPGNMYHYLQNLKPKEREQMLSRITHPGEGKDPGRIATLMPEEQEAQKPIKKYTDSDPVNQLRLLVSAEFRKQNPETYEKFLEHVFSNHFEAAREYLTNETDKKARKGANIVWKCHLRKKLEELSKFPENKTLYTNTLPDFAEGDDTLNFLKTTANNQKEDPAIRDMAKRILKDVIPLTRTKRKWRFWRKEKE
jgi:hypothetical protein